jgi:hypothetical protein
MLSPDITVSQLRVCMGDSIMKANEWVREAERESKLVDALYRARDAVAVHHGMTVRSEGEECALDFALELKLIDTALGIAGIDTARLRQ